MVGRTFFSSSVGIGSASQVFAGEVSTTFDTSSQLRGQNFARVLGIRRFSGCVSDDCVFCSRRSDLMLVILVMKNSLNLSASSWWFNPGGNSCSFFLPSRLSHNLNTCLMFPLCSRRLS